jgi:hypothetical protein
MRPDSPRHHPPRVTAAQFTDVLQSLLTADHLDGSCCGDDVQHVLDHLADIRTFEQAGVMTVNEGLVVRLVDGAEFQVTVACSA